MRTLKIVIFYVLYYSLFLDRLTINLILKSVILTLQIYFFLSYQQNYFLSFLNEIYYSFTHKYYNKKHLHSIIKVKVFSLCIVYIYCSIIVRENPIPWWFIRFMLSSILRKCLNRVIYTSIVRAL